MGGALCALVGVTNRHQQPYTPAEETVMNAVRLVDEPITVYLLSSARERVRREKRDWLETFVLAESLRRTHAYGCWFDPGHRNGSGVVRIH